MQRRALPAVLIGAVVWMAAAALPPASSADSLVYINGGQIWISHDDGSSAHQVTHQANGWAWPSEADNGTVLAAGGLARTFSDGSQTSGSAEIYRLTQGGAQIGGTTDTPASHSTSSCNEAAPEHVRVSPDGTAAAYDYVICSTSNTTAVWVQLRDATFEPPAPQHKGQLDFYAPFWVDNSRFLVSHFGKPYPAQAQFFLHTRTAPDNSDPGVGGDKNIDLPRYQVVASRTGKRLAVFEADTAGAQPSQAKIVLYTTDGNPGDPYFINGSSQHGDVPMCKLTLPPTSIADANLASPTFSYDGRELAWSENDGIHVANVSVLNMGTDVENVPECTTVSQRLLIPGGSEPFFGHGSESRPPTLTAAFSFSPAHPWVGRKVLFNGGRSHDRVGRIASYRWSFGDGSGASARTPKRYHAYRRRGRYTVTLTVTDKSHHTARARERVSVSR